MTAKLGYGFFRPFSGRRPPLFCRKKTPDNVNEARRMETGIFLGYLEIAEDADGTHH